MNTELLKKVADHIDRHPDAYDQSQWSYIQWTDADESIAESLEPGEYKVLSDPTECGTRACIAGWVCWLDPEIRLGYVIERSMFGAIMRNAVRFASDGGYDYFNDWKSIAQESLDLTWTQSSFLFDGDWCPPDGMTAADTLRKIAETGEMLGYVQRGEGLKKYDYISFFETDTDQDEEDDSDL
jgi:hypothetical protein